MDRVLEIFGYTDTSLKAQIFLIYFVCAVLVTVLVNWALAVLFIVVKPFICAVILLTFFRPDIAQNFFNEAFLLGLADKTKAFLCEVFVILSKLASGNKGRLMHTTTETPPQYDVSEKMRKLFELKQKQRESSRAYYQKLIMNPHRSKMDGVPFDPVLFRYNALMTYNVEYFRPNLSNMFLIVTTYILPGILFWWVVTTLQERSEREIRAGKIAYKDRLYKAAL